MKIILHSSSSLEAHWSRSISVIRTVEVPSRSGSSRRTRDEPGFGRNPGQFIAFLSRLSFEIVRNFAIQCPRSRPVCRNLIGRRNSLVTDDLFHRAGGRGKERRSASDFRAHRSPVTGYRCDPSHLQRKLARSSYPLLHPRRIRPSNR